MVEVLAKLIGIEISAQEADVFRKMREAGVFELREGNATLHFSKLGVLLKIDKHTFTSFNHLQNPPGMLP